MEEIISQHKTLQRLIATYSKRIQHAIVSLFKDPKIHKVLRHNLIRIFGPCKRA